MLVVLVVIAVIAVILFIVVNAANVDIRYCALDKERNGKGMGTREEATTFISKLRSVSSGLSFFRRLFIFFFSPPSRTALKQSDQLYFKLRSVRSALLFTFFSFFHPPPLQTLQTAGGLKTVRAGCPCVDGH